MVINVIRTNFSAYCWQSRWLSLHSKHDSFPVTCSFLLPKEQLLSCAYKCHVSHVINILSSIFFVVLQMFLDNCTAQTILAPCEFLKTHLRRHALFLGALKNYSIIDGYQLLSEIINNHSLISELWPIFGKKWRPCKFFEFIRVYVRKAMHLCRMYKLGHHHHHYPGPDHLGFCD